MFWRFCLTCLFFSSFILPGCSEKEEIQEIIENDSPISTDSVVIETGLPIISIITDDGTEISDRDTWKAGALEFKGGDRFGCFSDSIKVKGRGNASFHYPKKSFTLKFRNKQSLLGMPKHKRWVFQANYHDRTLLRNALTFHIGHFADGMEWNPHAEFAEVIFNGVHIGNYLVCEQIRADKNRVPISSDLTNDEVGGFLFEYDYYFNTTPRFFSPMRHFPVCIKYPDEEDCNEEQVDFAREFITTIEVLLFAHKYDQLFAHYLDLDSFVDYWIIMTITGNIEPAKPRSVYFYKKPSGKFFAGPLWDFDFSTYCNEEGTDNMDVLYYTVLFRSQVFRDRVKERWQELSPILRQEAVKFIMEERSYLSQSAEINYKLWPIISPYVKKCQNGDEFFSYQEAIDSLLSKTMARMDYVEKVVQNL